MSDLDSMSRPRILDLYCGAGGAGDGYRRAGFDVVGVDHEPQPSYPFGFRQADAIGVMDALLDGQSVEGVGRLQDFVALHGSPPCQAFTVYGNNSKHVRSDHPNLIPATRRRFQDSELLYVIENVPGAPLMNPVQLCGTSFPPLEVRRHRLFESNFPIAEVPCNHKRLTVRKYPGSSNRPNGRTVCNIGEWRVPLEIQRVAIDIDWMSVPELSQAVPPPYTQHIGECLLREIDG